MSLAYAQVGQLLAKTPFRLRQAILGAAYLFVPRRLPGLLPLAAMTLRDLPHVGYPLLPDPGRALANPDGLCGLAGRIGVEELLRGYGRGMFVMSHTGPLKWWAPRHRMVLFFNRAHVEKSIRKLIRSGRIEISFDRAFVDVVRHCARPRDGNPLTWITPRIQDLFERAHRDGHAHSVEVWENGVLVGGAYGLAVGRMFFTESQFHLLRDASKLAFYALNRHLQAWGFACNDGKHPTRHLANLGMLPVTREELSALASKFAASPGPVGVWKVDPRLLDDRWKPVEAAGYTMEELLPDGSACRWSVDDLLSERRSATW